MWVRDEDGDWANLSQVASIRVRGDEDDNYAELVLCYPDGDYSAVLSIEDDKAAEKARWAMEIMMIKFAAGNHFVDIEECYEHRDEED